MPPLGSTLKALRDVVTAVVDSAEPDDFDSWLLWSSDPASLLPLPALSALLSLRMAALAGLGRQERLALGVSAFLGSVGPQRLAEERLLHPAGERVDAQLLRLVQCLRERLDGSGPLGLKGEELDLASRLLTTAHAFEERRLSLDALDHRALAQIASDEGGFDAKARSVLVQALSAFPLGTFVRLSTLEQGTVVRSCAQDAMRPSIAAEYGPDGQPYGAPRLRELFKSMELRVTGLVEDPEAPGPALRESAESWLRRLAKAPLPAERPAKSLRPPRPEAPRLQAVAPEAKRGQPPDPIPRRMTILEETLRRQQRVLESLEHDQETLEAAEEGRLRSSFQLTFASEASRTDPELEELRRTEQRHQEELHRLDREVASLLADQEVRRFLGARREKVQDLKRLSELSVQRLAELERRRANAAVEGEHLRKRYAAALDSLQRRRERIRHSLKRRIQGLKEELRLAQAELARLQAELVIPPELSAAHAEWSRERDQVSGRRRALQDEFTSLIQEILATRERLQQLAGDSQRTDESHREELRRLRAEFAAACRKLQAEDPLLPLQQELGALRLELDRVRLAHREAAAKRQKRRGRREGGASRLESLRRLLRRQGEAWVQERSMLEAKALAKRRELVQLRDEVQKRELERERLLRESPLAKRAAQEGIASRLKRLTAAREARRKELEEALQRHREELRQGREALRLALAETQDEDQALEEEIRRLAAECGDLQGLLNARESQRGSLERVLQKSLSETGVKLDEARLALDALRQETQSLARTQEGELAAFEQLQSQLDVLLEDYLSRSREEASLWESWTQLNPQELLSAFTELRQEFLDRARAMGLWRSRVLEWGQRFQGAREAIGVRIASTCTQNAFLSFAAGDLEGARRQLERAQALRPDSAAQHLLDRLGRQAQPPGPGSGPPGPGSGPPGPGSGPPAQRSQGEVRSGETPGPNAPTG